MGEYDKKILPQAPRAGQVYHVYERKEKTNGGEAGSQFASIISPSEWRYTIAGKELKHVASVCYGQGKGGTNPPDQVWEDVSNEFILK